MKLLVPVNHGRRDPREKARRQLKRQQVLSLGTCAWIQECQNLILTGPTGIGKSYLACAFVERACRKGFNAYYVRTPRLLHQLAVAKGDGPTPGC